MNLPWFGYKQQLQRLTRKYKGTRRRYNLMSQALMAPYVNDWFGWFYPGFSGFHPQKDLIQKEMVLLRVLRFPSTQRIQQFYLILDFPFNNCKIKTLFFLKK